MAVNPGSGPHRAVDLGLFQDIAIRMEEHITRGIRRPWIPTEKERDRQDSIQFPQRLGGVEMWPGVDLRDYNLTELIEAAPIIKLPYAATRPLLSGAYRLAPAGPSNEPVDASMSNAPRTLLGQKSAFRGAPSRPLYPMLTLPPHCRTWHESTRRTRDGAGESAAPREV
jgi:hypothetical protein